MSARDSLDMALSRGVHLTRSVRQSLIDSFAHELAEEVRNAPYEDWGNEDRFHCGVSMAANLIDPEVEK